MWNLKNMRKIEVPIQENRLVSAEADCCLGHDYGNYFICQWLTAHLNIGMKVTISYFIVN